MKPGTVALSIGLAAWFAIPTGAAAQDRQEILDRANRLVWGAIEAVSEHHADPPVEQQMLLGVIRSAYRFAQIAPPADLQQRLSNVSGRAEMEGLLERALLHSLSRPDFQIPGGQRSVSERLEMTLLDGLFDSLEGRGQFIPPEEFRVQQQLRDNLYVGIGIQLGQDGGLPVIIKAFPGGPAQLSGIRDGDLILRVDGKATQDVGLGQVVQWLRGLQGEEVTVEVQHPDDDAARTIDMVRDVVPFQTVVGHRETEPGVWDFSLDEHEEIAYVRIDSIRASTPRELQVLAPRLRESSRGWIVDLRGTQAGDPRYAAMLAGLLAGEGVVGQLRRGHELQDVESGLPRLFPDWPMAVLIDDQTNGTAEWIAAAVQDRDQGVLIGEPTAGLPRIADTFLLPDERGAIRIWTATLTRADGRPLGPQRRALDPSTHPDVFGGQGVEPDLAASDPIREAVAWLREQQQEDAGQGEQRQ